VSERTRVLIVEDLPTDAELCEREIAKELGACEFRRAETREEFVAALEAFAPDLIISDYRLPHFDGMAALKIALERRPDLPFIILTGSMNEETAVECMKAGAWDYVIKEHVRRLGRAARHALEERRARDERRLFGQRYQDLVENSGTGIVMVDVEGRYLMVNKRAAAMFGRPAEEIVGKTMFDLLTPDAAAKYLTDNRRLIEAGGSREYIGAFTLTTGERTFLIVDRSVADASGRNFAVQSSSIDITEMRRAQGELAESEEKFRAISMSALDAVVLIDGAGKVVLWNPSAERAFGYAAGEILGRDAHEVLAPEKYRPQYKAGLRSFRSTGQGAAVGRTLELTARRKDGAEFPIEIAVAAVRVGQEYWASAIIRDVSDRKRAEDLVRTRLRLLEFAAGHSVRELLVKALDEVGSLTDSPLGFYHFVDPGQQTMSSQAWSTRTTAEFCAAPRQGPHYGVEEAGVWADCVRQRAPVVHNDYASLPHKRGMPAGHAPVTRELVVPIFRGDKVVAVLGVGNKPVDYAPSDVEVASYIADVAWEVSTFRRAEEELRTREETFRALAENSHDAIMRFDRAGRHLYVNPVVERQTGIPADAFIGKTHEELGFPADLCWLWSEAVQKVFRTGKVNRLEFQLPAGMWIDWLLTPEMGTDGEVAAVIGAGRDISEFKQLESERAYLDAQLRQQQKLEAIGRLASGVAHEINNPLTGIINYAELLQTAPNADERTQRFAGKIISEGHRVGKIVRSLLAFARQEKEGREEVNLNDVVRSAATLMEPTLRKDQIAVTMELQEELPLVTCRGQQIEQVVLNLITNARDALNQRYPAYDADKTLAINVRLCPGASGSGVRITVEDHGGGIPEEIRDRIFDPFFTTKPSGVGTGLGLAVSHGIVEEHGGSLTFESEAGDWTRFYLDLPIGPPIEGRT
jgi:PAS domain S-box-containing protein